MDTSYKDANKIPIQWPQTARFSGSYVTKARRSVGAIFQYGGERQPTTMFPPRALHR